MKTENKVTGTSERLEPRVLIDCPRCGAQPPVAHALGGGPGFDGIRTCGKGCGTWDDDDSKAWRAIRDSKVSATRQFSSQRPAT